MKSIAVAIAVPKVFDEMWTLFNGAIKYIINSAAKAFFS